jgi:hypothetical protein
LHAAEEPVAEKPAATVPATEQPAAEKPAIEPIAWQQDYFAAYTLAKQQARMLLIYFQSLDDAQGKRFDEATWKDEAVCRAARRYVCLRLPLDATIEIEDKPQKLLAQPAFREMLGRPGLAIIDLAHKDKDHFAHVVSTFPLTAKLQYTPQQVVAMLDLPPGTLTQRTLIYAVRTHPERPGSADGELHGTLVAEAASHAQHQADIRLQGHHQWETRFHRISAQLPAGLSASEVCAESWPGENLVEAAVECVRCWRLSSGHWGAVRERHRVFGYDMRRGHNGIWYATGIFGRR